MKRAMLCAIVTGLAVTTWTYAGVPLGPAILLSTWSLKFDNNQIGSTAQKTLTIENVGVAPLVVQSAVVTGRDAAMFKVAPATLAVDVGGRQTITVTFTQASAGSKSAVLSIVSNAYADPVTVNLTGPAATQKLSVGAAAGSRRSSVTVAISVDNAQAIAGGDLNLKYDPNVLNPRQVKGSDLLNAAGLTVVPNLAVSGQVKVSMAGAAGMVAGKGQLISVTFDIKPAARLGASPLVLQSKLVDENGQVFATTSEPGSVTVLVIGDVSGDQEIGAADAVLVLRHAAGLITLTDAQKDIGDVNGDKALNSADAILILRYSAGIITKFPRETAAKLMAAAALGASIELREPLRMTAVPKGEQVLAVPLVLGPGVGGGDLLLRYDASLFRLVGVDAPYGALVATNAERPGQVRLSVARPEALQPAVLSVRLEGDPARLSAVLHGVAYGVDGDRLEVVDIRVARPQVSSLSGYPNPFNAATTLRYELAEAGPVELVVYSITGSAVRHLVSGWQGAGSYCVVWDGRDEHGQPVGTGLYMGCLQSSESRMVHKLLLLK